MDLFEKYEDDFLDTKKTVEERLTKSSGLQGIAKSQEISQAKLELQDCETFLGHMEMAVKTSPNAQKLLGRFKEYQQDVQKMKTRLRKIEIEATNVNNKESLFSGQKVEVSMQTSNDQRENFVQMTDRLHKTSNVLDSAIREAEETKELGIDTLHRLDEQTNTLDRIMSKMGDIKDQLKDGRKLMQLIGRKLMTNKLILAVIIIVLLAGMGGILWLKFR